MDGRILDGRRRRSLQKLTMLTNALNVNNNLRHKNMF
jgi:hypothetical protein